MLLLLEHSPNTHNRPRYNYSDPFVLHLWYYGKVSRHLYLHLYLSYHSNVFGYLIWYKNDNSNCDDGRIVKEKTKFLYCMSNKGCRQSWRCSRHEWRREHHPTIILTSTFNYIGTIHIKGNITMRHNCSYHSAINVNFFYENWWIYCISIWRSFLWDFVQIFSMLCARFVFGCGVAFPRTVIQQTRIEHMQAQNNRHNHFHNVHNVYVYHTFAH